MDRLKLGLDAGLGFEWALRRSVRNQRGLLEMELKRMLAMLDRGHTKAQAFDQFVQRNPSEDLRSFAAAVKQAERLGSPLTKSLEVQGRLLRARRRRRAQQASRRLPVLIVFPLVFFFLPALLIIYLGPPLLHLFLGQ
jgi:tight adherence protein C